MTSLALDRRRSSALRERRFFTAMAAVVLLATFAGFAPSYYLRGIIPSLRPADPLPAIVQVHGLVFSCWVLLFAIQVGLVAAGRVDLHRRLGMAGLGLIAVMLPLALAVAVGGLHRPQTAPPGIDPRAWFAVPMLDLPVFGTLVVLALAKRRRPAAHKRLMLVAMTDMMGPGLGRLLPMLGVPGPFPLLAPVAFLVPLFLWDRAALGRVHPATLWGSIAVTAAILLKPVVWMTPGWLAFAGWVAAHS